MLIKEDNSKEPSIKIKRSKLLFGFLVNFHSKDTRDAYRSDLRIFLDFLLKQFEITEFRAEHAHFVAYKNFLIEKGLSHSSINRKLATASSYIDYLFQEGLRKDNPFLRIRRFKENPEGKTPAISIEQLHTAVSKLNSDSPTGKLRIALITVFFNTGMRVNELCNIKLCDFGTDERGVFFRYIGKGEKFMKHYPTQNTVAAISDYLNERENIKGPILKSSYLFVSFATNAGIKLSRTSVNFIFSEVFEELKELGISPHSARATFITEVVRREGLVSAQKRVGHSDPRSTKKYERLEINDEFQGLI